MPAFTAASMSATSSSELIESETGADISQILTQPNTNEIQEDAGLDADSMPQEITNAEIENSDGNEIEDAGPDGGSEDAADNLLPEEELLDGENLDDESSQEGGISLETESNTGTEIEGNEDNGTNGIMDGSASIDEGAVNLDQDSGDLQTNGGDQNVLPETKTNNEDTNREGNEGTDNKPQSSRIVAQWLADQNGNNLGNEIMPSGRFNVDSYFNLCVLVAATSTNDIAGVYGQIFYPNDRAFPENNKSGRTGCGQAATACTMTPQKTAKWQDLICRQDVALISGEQDGEDICPDDNLPKEMTVYCCDQSLNYDDIGGKYRTETIVKGRGGNNIAKLEGAFDYQEKAAYEINFRNINYGTVGKNIPAVAKNYTNLNGEAVKAALIRNLGNINLKILINQDNMGIQENSQDNLVSYEVLPGPDNKWINYGPDEEILLPEILDLSEEKRLEFSVIVKQFIPEPSLYEGRMLIEVMPADNYQCQISKEEKKSDLTFFLEGLNQFLPVITAKPEFADDLTGKEC